MFTSRPKMQGGFTLIELAIVVSILGILAAIVAPRLASSRADANTSAVRADLAILNTASVRYQLSNSGQKLTLAAVNTNDPVANLLLAGSYLDKMPSNPLTPSTGTPTGVGPSGTASTSLGWYYNATTGVFTASGCSATSYDGTPYDGTGTLAC